MIAGPTADTPKRPVPIAYAFDNIPAELKAIPQWCGWRYEFRDKWTKPPLRGDGKGRASSTDPATWADYQTAVATQQRGDFDGIGFVLTPTIEIVGVDLDHCYNPDSKSFEPWATAIIDHFESYTEVSPSGTGVRIFLKGKLPAGGHKKGNIEIYSSGRYLTVTGRVLKTHSPRVVEPRQAELEAFLAEHFPEPKIEKRAGAASNGNSHLSDHEIVEIGFHAKNGDKLRSLLDGDCDGYPSASEAELALCRLLGFYTKDESQIDRIYRGSKLFREKWDEKHYGDGATYGERTIQKAISGATDTYSGKAERLYAHNSLFAPSLPAQPTIDQAAFHGLAGEIVIAVSPYSESDPTAILINTLTAFGSVIGSGPHFLVEKSQHHLNLFGVQVGRSAKGRKGTAWSTPRYMFESVDPDWGAKRIRSGLSSGEGLVYAVRDARYETKPIREKGRVAGNERVLVDEGETDKRLLCVEEEFSQCLKVMNREGNILSATLRDAWDGKRLAPMTKNSPIEATGAHVSIVAHITKDELLRYFTSTEQTNGFGNRFMWFFVKRTREIPTPTGCPDETLNPLIEKLRDSVNFARKVSTIIRDEEAEAIWRSVYHDLSSEKDGLVGALLARSEPQVMRLACIYSLLDSSDKVMPAHLEAALALWGYCEQSANFIFGELTGDTTADRILAAIAEHGEMTETDIYNLFGRHKSSSQIDIALSTLRSAGKAKSETISTGGRPATVWRRSAISAESAKR